MLHVHLIACDAIENAEIRIYRRMETTSLFTIDFSFIFQSQIAQEFKRI